MTPDAGGQDLRRGGSGADGRRWWASWRRDAVTATYSRTAGEKVGAYVISATLAAGGVLGNYDITYNTGSFNIAKKAASVTPSAAGKDLRRGRPGADRRA